MRPKANPGGAAAPYIQSHGDRVKNMETFVDMIYGCSLAVSAFEPSHTISALTSYTCVLDTLTSPEELTVKIVTFPLIFRGCWSNCFNF